MWHVQPGLFRSLLLFLFAFFFMPQVAQVFGGERHHADAVHSLPTAARALPLRTRSREAGHEDDAHSVAVRGGGDGGAAVSFFFFFFCLRWEDIFPEISYHMEAAVKVELRLRNFFVGGEILCGGSVFLFMCSCADNTCTCPNLQDAFMINTCYGS